MFQVDDPDIAVVVAVIANMLATGRWKLHEGSIGEDSWSWTGGSWQAVIVAPKRRWRRNPLATRQYRRVRQDKTRADDG